MIKKVIKSLFNIVGLDVIRKQSVIAPQYDYFRNEQMIAGMKRAKERGLTSIETIVDIGAAQGSWALSAKEFWPLASYVLFEPLEERRSELEALCSRTPKFHFVPAAAGKEKGTINFHVSDDLDGSGIADGVKGVTNIRTIQVESIDDKIQKLGLQGPFIVKLDTHGYEVPIIEGCASIMGDIKLFIIECYGFQIAKDSLLFWEMCQYMASKGFRLIDIVDVANRPKDGAFWQCDAFFIPDSEVLFQDNSFA